MFFIYILLPLLNVIKSDVKHIGNGFIYFCNFKDLEKERKNNENKNENDNPIENSDSQK